MYSVIKCLLRNCFETPPDGNNDDDDNSSVSSSSSVDPNTNTSQPHHIHGLFPVTGVIHSYLSPENSNPATGTTDPDTTDILILTPTLPNDCTADRHNDDNTSVTTAGGSSVAEGGGAPTPAPNTPLSHILSRLGIRPCGDGGGGRHAKFRPPQPRFIPLGSLNDSVHSLRTPSTDEDKKRPSKKEALLKEACSFQFDAQKEVLSIQSSEFVMPGSDMQKRMALAMSKQHFAGDGAEDECVICMDTFSYENPRMPTLCGCGENNTYFHLPCLYQWIEQNQNCPSCRKRLRWEEF